MIKKYLSIMFVLLCLIFIGCGNNFNETHNILEKRELKIEELNEKTSNVDTIITTLKENDIYNYDCILFEESFFEKSFVPITKRCLTTYSLSENVYSEVCDIQLYSSQYNYFENEIISSYISNEDDISINYVVNENIFEEKRNIDSGKFLIGENIELSNRYPLYCIFLKNEYKDNNTSLVQLSDCKINDELYYRIEFNTMNYSDYILGSESIYYTKNPCVFTYYINQSTMVVDYLIIETKKDTGENYYSFIGYLENKDEVKVPNELLELDFTQIEEEKDIEK